MTHCIIASGAQVRCTHIPATGSQARQFRVDCEIVGSPLHAGDAARAFAAAASDLAGAEQQTPPDIARALRRRAMLGVQGVMAAGDRGLVGCGCLQWPITRLDSSMQGSTSRLNLERGMPRRPDDGSHRAMIVARPAPVCVNPSSRFG